jgi:hypothetical protein
MNVKVGVVTVPQRNSGETVYESVGFAPQAILFVMSDPGSAFGYSDTNTLDTTVHFSFGMYANSKNRVTCCSQLSGTINSHTTISSDDDCVMWPGSGDTFFGRLSVQSTDGSGFTLLSRLESWDASTPIAYIAIGGIDNADIQDVGLADGDQTPFSFDPDFLFMSHNQSFGTGILSEPAQMVWGMTDGTNQYAFGFSAHDDATDEQLCGHYIYNGEMIAGPGDAPAVGSRYAFTSFITNGWNWDELEAGSGAAYILGLKANGQIKCGDILSRTDTTQIVETGIGFKPAALMVLSGNYALSTQDVSDDVHARASVGFVGGTTNRRTAGLTMDDSSNPAVSSGYWQTDCIYVNNDDVGTGIVGKMDLVSFDSDGFTAVMDDPDPAACFVIYIAFQGEEGTRGRIMFLR